MSQKEKVIDTPNKNFHTLLCGGSYAITVNKHYSKKNPGLLLWMRIKETLVCDSFNEGYILLKQQTMKGCTMKGCTREVHGRNQGVEDDFGA